MLNNVESTSLRHYFKITVSSCWVGKDLWKWYGGNYKHVVVEISNFLFTDCSDKARCFILYLSGHSHLSTVCAGTNTQAVGLKSIVFLFIYRMNENIPMFEQV